MRQKASGPDTENGPGTVRKLILENSERAGCPLDRLPLQMLQSLLFFVFPTRSLHAVLGFVWRGYVGE